MLNPAEVIKVAIVFDGYYAHMAKVGHLNAVS